jgi:hypothetical protein
MIKINIDTTILEGQGVTINELLALIKVKHPKISFTFSPIIFTGLMEKGLAKIVIGFPEITPKGKELIAMFSSDIEDNIGNLAKNLMDLFPSGKKGGLYYWKGNLSEVETKLKTFFKKYGTSYTEEQIELATSKYIKSFDDTNRDKAMMLLKYFIEKNGTSTLLSYLENIEEAKTLEVEYGKSRAL